MEEYVVLTPLNARISRIERFAGKPDDRTEYNNRGIIVRAAPPSGQECPGSDEDVSLSFSVYLIDKETSMRSKELRILRFWFIKQCDDHERLQTAQEFFKELLRKEEFPKDYGNFIKRLLKLLKGRYLKIVKLELELKATECEPELRPPVSQHAYESSVWEQAEQGLIVETDHIQEVLEHAYPTAMTTDLIAHNLKCSENEVHEHLMDLQTQGVATRLDNGMWVRSAPVFEKRVDPDAQDHAAKNYPTVAIITALYVEKLAIDSMIEDAETFVRYKTDGESNVYTLGRLCGHRVVATKLSAVGHSREARTAAGSVTTRLLGGFQSIKHVFIVGVGGGVPHYTDASRHVRLGDVVISLPSPNPTVSPALKKEPPCYVYCEDLILNRKTDKIEGYSVKSWGVKDNQIADASKQLWQECQSSEIPVWAEHCSGALKKVYSVTDASFARPPQQSDKLYMWVDVGSVVEVSHPVERNYSALHLGPIGSGRCVVKDHQLRAEFANEFGVCAYDQEFDSVVESVLGNQIDSWVLIRGIADYVDGTRNKEWQAYAALQAAAVTKSLIDMLPN